MTAKSRDLRPLWVAILMGFFGASLVTIGEDEGMSWLIVGGGCAVGISLGALLSMFESKS